jgi:hypothetical protein
VPALRLPPCGLGWRTTGLLVSPRGRRRLGLRRSRGTRPFRDAKLWPVGGRAWDSRETGTEHRPGILCADVTELLKHEPELMILSRGHQRRLSVSPETLSLLETRGVPVLRVRTDAALAVDRQGTELGPMAEPC